VLVLVALPAGLVAAFGPTNTALDATQRLAVVEAGAVPETAFSMREPDVRGRGLDRLPVVAVGSLVVVIGGALLAADRARRRTRFSSGSAAGRGVTSRAPPACA
jgi:hypothetical protein